MEEPEEPEDGKLLPTPKWASVYFGSSDFKNPQDGSIAGQLVKWEQNWYREWDSPKPTLIIKTPKDDWDTKEGVEFKFKIDGNAVVRGTQDKGGVVKNFKEISPSAMLYEPVASEYWYGTIDLEFTGTGTITLDISETEVHWSPFAIKTKQIFVQ